MDKGKTQNLSDGRMSDEELEGISNEVTGGSGEQMVSDTGLGDSNLGKSDDSNLGKLGESKSNYIGGLHRW